MDNQAYTEALALAAAQDFRVFKTREYQYAESDYHNATSDQTALALENAAAPNADWAVHTGHGSRVVCLYGKPDSFRSLEELAGCKLPQTLTIANPKKKNVFCLYARQSEQHVELANFVAVRGTGVQVRPFALLPGSKITNGFLFWLLPRTVTPLAPLPDGVFLRLPKERNRLRKADAPALLIDQPQTLDIVERPEFDPRSRRPAYTAFNDFDY